MSTPGFTAEAALSRTRDRHVTGPNILAGDGQISPQFVLPPPCTCYFECYGTICFRVCYCRFPVPLGSGAGSAM